MRKLAWVFSVVILLALMIGVTLSRTDILRTRTRKTGARAPTTGIRTAQSSANAEFDADGFLLMTTENEHFSFVEMLESSGRIDYLLLQESFLRKQRDGSEGPSASTVRVRAWALDDKLRQVERWRLEESGDDGQANAIFPTFYKVSKFGCCDSHSVYSYFSMRSGRKIYRSTVDLSEVQISDAGAAASRYIAYDDSSADQDITLQYGSDERVFQTLRVHVPMRTRPPALQTRYGSDLGKTPLVKEGASTSFSAFTILLRYQDGLQLQLPVERDKIRIDLAVLPASFRIIEAK